MPLGIFGPALVCMSLLFCQIALLTVDISNSGVVFSPMCFVLLPRSRKPLPPPPVSVCVCSNVSFASAPVICGHSDEWIEMNGLFVLPVPNSETICRLLPRSEQPN